MRLLLQADNKEVELDFLEAVWEGVGPLDGGAGGDCGVLRGAECSWISFPH